MAASAFAREQLWDGLRAVALPDSRFHLRFSEFIPDFSGSDAAIDRLWALPGFDAARHVFVRPGAVPKGHELYGAWPDGLAHFGEPLTLNALADLGAFDFVATGASAVATSGVRFGRGHGFFDLEWRIFSDMGLVGNLTPLVTVVHDVQLLDKKLYPSPDDVLVDWICTPTRSLQVARETQRPRGLNWKDITPEQVHAIPALAELRRIIGLA